MCDRTWNHKSNLQACNVRLLCVFIKMKHSRSVETQTSRSTGHACKREGTGWHGMRIMCACRTMRCMHSLPPSLEAQTQMRVQYSHAQEHWYTRRQQFVCNPCNNNLGNQNPTEPTLSVCSTLPMPPVLPGVAIPGLSAVSALLRCLAASTSFTKCVSRLVMACRQGQQYIIATMQEVTCRCSCCRASTSFTRCVGPLSQTGGKDTTARGWHC